MYYVVMYENNERLPIPFETWQQANDYIFSHKLHAYITIS